MTLTFLTFVFSTGRMTNLRLHHGNKLRNRSIGHLQIDIVTILPKYYIIFICDSRVARVCVKSYNYH